MSSILLASPTIGAFWTSKTLSFVDQPDERPGERTRSITGATIHQVGAADAADRTITGEIRFSSSDRSTLESFLTEASSFIAWLQDGTNVYKGYLKTLTANARPAPNRDRFSFTFYVTEKEK